MTSASPVLYRNRVRLALLAGPAFAAAVVSGCTGAQSLKSASAALPESAASTSDAKVDKAVAKAEKAVAGNPQDAAARAVLGQSYLAAGRFNSAATALNDAMALGDNSGKTALGLALARIGEGRHRDAVAILDDWRGEIPASDLGLALALAGETSRGVAILADTLRKGESTPKLRQNLAYAFALDGRWYEAKLMAAQDTPAAELDKRLAVWALSTLPDRNQDRVAGLIGAPLRRDPGQPAALALKASPATEQLAAEAGPSVLPAPMAAELPAVAAAPQTGIVEANLAAQTAPAPMPAAQVAPSRSFGAAIAATAIARHPTLAKASYRAAPVHRIASGGTHFVQLGSFASEQGARRAWGFFTHRDRSLAAYRMTITPATVNGKQYWRVAAGGLNGRVAATGLCSQVKARGGNCFAYAGSTKAVPVPTAPTRDIAGPQRARR